MSLRTHHRFGLAVAAILVVGCGSSHNSASSTTGAASSSTSAASSSTPAATSEVPGEIRARVLSANELAGFRSAGVSVYTTASGWMSGEQGLPAAQLAAERRMLTRDGFSVGARENLMRGSTQGLSTVQQFRSPSAARDAFGVYASQFKAPPSSGGTYASFKVSGIPGAMGFSLGDAGGGGINIAFTDGSDYYVVGRVVVGRLRGQTPAVASLTAAARHLYQRVHG